MSGQTFNIWVKSQERHPKLFGETCCLTFWEQMEKQSSEYILRCRRRPLAPNFWKDLETHLKRWGDILSQRCGKMTLRRLNMSFRHLNMSLTHLNMSLRLRHPNMSLIVPQTQISYDILTCLERRFVHTWGVLSAVRSVCVCVDRNLKLKTFSASGYTFVSFSHWTVCARA